MLDKRQVEALYVALVDYRRTMALPFFRFFIDVAGNCCELIDFLRYTERGFEVF
jgi:hypothetical protein